MSTIDYINTLGAGAGFNTKEIVSALVEAERAPSETRLNEKIENSEAQISALGLAKSALANVKNAADALNDASDFNTFNTHNSQPTALTISADSNATEGSHSITVSSVAREQRTNFTPHGASEFSSSSQLLNSGVAFDLSIVIGDSSTVTHSINVATTTPQGIVDAINSANLDVKAQLIDKGTTDTEYIVQLVGKSGTDNQFTVTPSVNNMLASDTPTGSTAANASLTVNGVNFSRSENSITDIIPGVQLDLNAATSGAASLSITQDTTAIDANIRSLVESFNTARSSVDELTNREKEGALAGDSVFRQSFRSILNLFTTAASTPGDNLSSLSDLGISITKAGLLEINDATLSSNLSSNLADVRKILSADTENQTDIGDANRGIAGDISKLINDLNSSTGYFSRQTSTLENGISDYQKDLDLLEERMENLQARYTQQFASMNSLIEELNNTRDNLISSFDNLPFTNKD